MSSLRKRKLKPSFVRTIASAAALVTTAGALGMACSSQEIISNPPPPACAPLAPSVGAACSLGVTPALCTYNDALYNAKTFECKDAKWIVGTAASRSAPDCPSAQPKTGDVCPTNCERCKYAGTPPCEASGPLATCQNGKWNVSVATCNPPPPPFDGGSEDSGISADGGDGGK
jgi:hypothetical protein